MDDCNFEMATIETRGGDGTLLTTGSTEPNELQNLNNSMMTDQENDVILSLNAVSIVEEDFLATIPMPDTMSSGIIPPEILVPKKEKKKKEIFSLDPPPPPSPPPSPSPLIISNTSSDLIETEEKVPEQSESYSSPTMSVSPDGHERRHGSRWDRVIVGPKPSVRTPTYSNSVSKIVITTAFEKSPMKTSPASPTIVMAKGTKRGITFGRNLGFRTFALLQSGQASNGEDTNNERYSGVSENGTESNAVSTMEFFGPGSTETNENYDMPSDFCGNLEKLEKETGFSFESKANKELKNWSDLNAPPDEIPVSDVTPQTEFKKFKFLLSNTTADTLILREDGVLLPPSSAPVSAVYSSGGEDSNSCGAERPAPPPPLSTVNSEAEVSTPTDSQNESSNRDLASVESKQSPRRPSRRRNQSPHYRSGESYYEVRRRSSRIRSIKERRDRERERSHMDDTSHRRRKERKNRKETKEYESRNRRTDKYDVMRRSPVSPDIDRNVRQEMKKTEVDSYADLPISASTIECIISPHLIPLPPMPPPARPVLFRPSAPRSPVPFRPSASRSPVPFHHHRSLSPVGGGDDFSVKPEKVKSRWRRNSELERVCTMLPPPSFPVPNFIPPHRMPFQMEPWNQNHYEFGGKSTPQRFHNNVSFNGPYSNPPPFVPPTHNTHFNNDVVQANKTFNCHSMAPVLKGPPPPPPPVCGFFDEGEVTEDWSEKEVTSSLTKNPLPLKLRVVNPIVATSEPGRNSDSTVSKSNSLPKSSTAAAVLVPKEKPAHLNFEEITENIFLSERRRWKSKREVRRMVCDCTITKEEIDQGFVACGDDCLNRLLMMECGSRCPTGEYCTNRRFQKKQYANIEAFKTEKKGWGVKTNEELQSGSFVLEYVGEVLDQREFKKRVKEYAHDRHRHYYFMALRADEIIDATQKGNFSRFINHSCDPNCETQKWTVNGELRVGFFTRRLIHADEELTFDYQFQRYGKEAQKCFCEAPNCRGLIGGDKQTPLKKDRRDVKKKKSFEERRREELEDMDLEEEIEKFNQLGGLKNRVQVLNLCRMMVRAEETEFRLVLLHSLQKTHEQACLRLFLDYHGLSLLWSWMVDIGNGDATLSLKSEILKTLQKLPISNKNVLTDSKVMPVVQRWAVQIVEYMAKVDYVASESSVAVSSKENGLGTEDSSSDYDTQQPKVTGAGDSKDTSDDCFPGSESSVALSTLMNNADDQMEDNRKTDDISPEEVDKVTSDSETGTTDVQIESDKENEDNLSIEEKIMKMEGESEISLEEKNGESTSHSEEQPSTVKSEVSVVDVESHVVSPSSPSHQQSDVKVEIKNTACEAKEISSLTSELLDTWSTLKEVYRIPKREQNQNRLEHEREADEQENNEKDRDCDKDRRDRTWDRDGDRRDGDWRYDRSRDKYDRHDDRHRSNIDYDRGSRPKSGRDSPPDKERKGKRDRWRGDNDESERKRHDGFANKQNKLQRRREFELKVQQEEEEAIRRQHEEYYRLQQEAQMMAVDPNMYYDSNYCPIPPHGGHVPFFDPATCYPIPAVPIATQDSMVIMGAIAPPDIATAVIEEGPPLAVASSSPSSNVAAVPAQIVYPIYPPGSGPPVSAGYIAPSPQQGAAPQFVPPQGQPLYYPPQGVVVHLPDQTGPWNQVVPNTIPEENSPPPPEPPKPVQPAKLPTGWKTAKDSEGNVYYYHAVTRQTQWEPPVADEIDLELEALAFEEPKKKKGTTTAAADTSSEVARRIKEFFRSKMSQFIVQCLNPYRKPDCKLGRISSTDEFKHLARKLTHFVMAKELKHCRNVEDLECNENVKHKAKDFVRKYMAKFGPIYKKAASPKDEDEDDD